MAQGNWILVVDDDAMVAELVSIYISDLEIRAACSSAAALDTLAASATPPVLVMVDHNLGQENGFEVSTMLLERDDVTRLVVMSAAGVEELSRDERAAAFTLVDKRTLETVVDLVAH